MAAGGLMYTAQWDAQPMTNVAQNLWEIAPSASVSIVIHSIKIAWVPTISGGVAQDFRFEIRIAVLSALGTGGTVVTPTAVNPRNTVAPTCAFNRMVVTTLGTWVSTKDPEMTSIVVPWERQYSPDQRLPMSGGQKLAIQLPAAPGFSSALTSSTIYYEEI